MVAIRLGHDRYIRSPMFCSECFVQYFMVRQIYIYIYIHIPQKLIQINP